MATPKKRKKRARILFVQAGDYREAFHRLRNGGDETYYAQKFTVDYVSKLSRATRGVGVISHAAGGYAELLPNGVMSYGLNLWQADARRVLDLVEAFGPTHLVLRVPVLYLLDWAIQHRVTTLPLLAESFASGHPPTASYYAQVRARLNHPRIKWVANHNVPASLSLADLGVAAPKIIPYDYEAGGMRTPDFYAPKGLDGSRRRFKLIFVGSLLVEKGLSDCIESLRHLRDNGLDVTLTIVGPGRADFFEALWNTLGMAPYVDYKGVVPNADVIPLMREHDAALIPSRHEYPEGLPLTLYEALCARTPVIVSDHAMLRARIRNGETGLVFEAGNASGLAAQVHALLSDPDLYARLSAATGQAWRQLQCPVKWDQLLDRFIMGSRRDDEWLAARTLPHHLPVLPLSASTQPLPAAADHA